MNIEKYEIRKREKTQNLEFDIRELQLDVCLEVAQNQAVRALTHTGVLQEDFLERFSEDNPGFLDSTAENLREELFLNAVDQLTWAQFSEVNVFNNGGDELEITERLASMVDSVLQLGEDSTLWLEAARHLFPWLGVFDGKFASALEIEEALLKKDEF